MERPPAVPAGPVKAPLATPEPIEISEYAQVRVRTPSDLHLVTYREINIVLRANLRLSYASFELNTVLKFSRRF